MEVYNRALKSSEGENSVGATVDAALNRRGGGAIFGSARLIYKGNIAFDGFSHFRRAAPAIREQVADQLCPVNRQRFKDDHDSVMR
jgi:hypothetical protein